MAMVLKASEKSKVLQFVYTKDSKTVTESINNIKDSAADSDIYEVAQAIISIKEDQCKVNIHLKAKDFNIVDDSVGGGSGEGGTQTETELDDLLEYSQEFIMVSGEARFNPAVKFSGTDVKITDRMVYGPNLDGQNRQIKIYYLGYQGNLLAEPKEVPLEGFDTFEAPSMEGKWSYDSTMPELSFTGGSASTKVYRIVKTKGVS